MMEEFNKNYCSSLWVKAARCATTTSIVVVYKVQEGGITDPTTHPEPQLHTLRRGIKRGNVYADVFSCAFKPSDKDSESDLLAPMITWKDFQKLMPWEIVVLVGGGYALAAGCKVRVCFCIAVTAVLSG